MSGNGIPVDIEVSEINSSLNSTILNIFLMGIYTMIYFGTMYIYFTKNSSNRLLVPATITLLYLTSIVQTGVQWYLTKWQFINSGETRDSVFRSLYVIPPWSVVVIIVSQYIGFVLSDGLLIWRCYFVWNHSVLVISVLLLLIIIEAGLFLAEIVIHSVFMNLIISQKQAARSNNVLAAAYFMSFATSLVATILIAYRIYSVSKEGVSRRRFKHIVDIVVQSGAVYSLVLLTNAIAFIVPGTGNIFNKQLFALSDYETALALPAIGMSATILVARIALLAPETMLPSTSVHLSGLQFRAQSTHHTYGPEGMETTHSVNNSHSVREEVQGKV